MSILHTSDTPMLPQTTTRVFPNGTMARQQAEREGSLAALVCNPAWRLAREL